jgi:hypothetical protein
LWALYPDPREQKWFRKDSKNKNNFFFRAASFLSNKESTLLLAKIIEKMNRTNLDFFIMFFILQKCFPEKKEKIPAPVILIARYMFTYLYLLVDLQWPNLGLLSSIGGNGIK